MTIEIKELIIKASINKENKSEFQPDEDSVDKQEIISSCVEQVLKILERDKER